MAEVPYKVGRKTTTGAIGMSHSGGSPPRAAPRSDNRVLAGLPLAELGLLAPHLQVVSLPAGALSQPQGAALDHVYFPHQGVLSMLATTSRGETIEIASAGRDGAICPILASEPHDLLVAAIGPGPLRASRIPVGRLRAASAPGGALAVAMDACREALLLELRQNLVCCGLHPVERRLARWLLGMADRLEADTVPATQEHVAQRLGVRRTTVTLLASKLQDSGAIRWGRSRVQVLDRSRLATLACGCYAALRARMRAPPLPAASGPEG